MEDESHSYNSIVGFILVEDKPERIVSAAILEEHTRMFHITSFLDNQHYSNFEALVIQLNPKEDEVRFKLHLAIKTQISSEREKVLDKVVDADYSICDSDKVASTELQLALNFLLSSPFNHHLKVAQNKKGLRALQKLLTILSLDKDETNKQQYELSILSLEKFMKLDKPVINALQIFPKDMGKKVISGANTLFQILNKCKTAIGTRCLKRWMKQPLQSEQAIKSRLDQVQFFIKHASIKNAIQNQLKKIPDLDALYYVFYKVKAGKKKNNVAVNDLIKIYRTIKTLEGLLQNLQEKAQNRQILKEILSQIKKSVNTMMTICKMIEDNLIMDERDSQTHVRPDAQESLIVISKEKQRVLNSINKHMRQVQRQLGGITVEKMPSVTHKFVFEADKKNSIETVKEKEDYKFLTAKQNKITFTTDDLIGFCKEYLSLEEQYKEKEQGILKQMFSVVAGYYPVMERLSVIISQLDILTTFASIVNANSTDESTWSRPIFGEGIVGTRIHHPCIRGCVPNNVDISNQKTIILTGPNMGGKSTYIRTIGIAVYLAHIGCYVPARTFQTPIIDSIITRVGASDMQIKGISTFMSQMIESSCMLHTATSKSLVLMDQLGRGTSTAEGFGLAWGICHELHTKTNPFCLFATHYHEMTKMPEELEGIKNMYTSCKIEQDELKLEYKVVEGKMEQSYGIQVAKMLQFPKPIIQQAQAYLQLYESKDSERHLMGGLTKNKEKKKEIALELYQEMEERLTNCRKEDEEDVRREYTQKIKKVLV